MDSATSLPELPLARLFSQRERVTAVAGILFIILTIFGVYFEFNAPDANNTLESATTAFATGRDAMTHASILFVISIPFFFIFLVGLCTVLRRMEMNQSGTTTLSDLVLATGVVYAALAIAFITIYGSLATLILDDVDAQVGLALLRLANALDIASDLFIGIMTISASIITFRAKTIPRWISWVGFISGIGQCGIIFTFGTDGFSTIADTVGFIGLLAFVVWMLAISITFLRRARHDKSRPYEETSTL
jgi:hypothetical protein